MKGTEQIHENGTDAKVEELVFHGHGASKGIAIGNAFVFRREKITPESRTLPKSQVEHELSRLQTALERSEKELRKIEAVTVRKLGEIFSDIFSAQIMMLHDEVLISRIRGRICEELQYADAIVDQEISIYQEMMLASDDMAFRERATDIEDLKERIIRNLHSGSITSRVDEDSIVISSMLTPADVVLFSRQNVMGCATDGGGLTSHVSLICRSLNIPMVVGLHNISEKVHTGQPVILDGISGTVFVNPTPERLEEYMRRKERVEEMASRLTEFAEKDTYTKCGKRVHIYSNIDFKEELSVMEKYGSEGVGLYRSESLFVSRGKAPSEEEQYNYYKDLAACLAPKPLTIRLFDVGGDKLLVSSYKEQNPNLGWRGIRVLIDVPDILENQVRAMLRANVHGNIKMLLPMIASMEEVFLIKRRISEISQKLKSERALFNEALPIGVMVEMPAAVEIVDELLAEVDFLSVGTNDLIQYTLAVDRNNDVVQDLYRKFHPAIIRMIARVIKRAKHAGSSVSICGEMAADPLAAPLLLGLGLDEFSVVNSSIPELKKTISSCAIQDAEQLAARCLELPTTEKIEQTLKHFSVHNT
ncbi:phosphoenolpyruvate-protein phosphotransferase [Chloroherpeton thalassium ATCC 35110]|uniref:Phosphoenolpyruvate-protein phosphotransferase n=1 Tax=Chloroherpeton thalassium (strain ATCC 35110 / GB-78) TaxID=517418 RepID=B3QY15_CHLT3|nr:phosphoenolpyruvate--protein phosphotransferase [Chloroherpeton thalassium]ACF13543.1 phosphoenolpyruvate-protein phosphotransferase [Chloroherpeton thalassium ATCC 35110]